MAKTLEERRAYFRDKMRKWRADHPDKVKEASSRYYANNKENMSAKAKAWNARNPHYATIQSRRWRAANPDKIKCKSLRRSGFTLALKNKTLHRQNYKCAICHGELKGLKPYQVHADHCHATGKPRGILCQFCNTGLGNFRDDPVRLRSAAIYLEEHANA